MLRVRTNFPFQPAKPVGRVDKLLTGFRHPSPVEVTKANQIDIPPPAESVDLPVEKSTTERVGGLSRRDNFLMRPDHLRVRRYLALDPSGANP